MSTLGRGAVRALSFQGFWAGRVLMGCGLQPGSCGQNHLTGTPGKAPWGWVRPRGAGCPVGRLDEVHVCALFSPRSRRAPSVLQGPPFMASAFSATGDAGTPEAMAPSSWSPRATGVWWPAPARPPWSASPAPGTQLAPACGRGPLPSSSGRPRARAHQGRSCGCAQACSAASILDATFILEVGAFTVGQAECPLRFWLRSRGELRPLMQREALTPSSVVLGALHPVECGRPTLESWDPGLPCSGVPPSSAYSTFFSGASGTVGTYGPLLLQLAILAQQRRQNVSSAGAK